MKGPGDNISQGTCPRHTNEVGNFWKTYHDERTRTDKHENFIETLSPAHKQDNITGTGEK